MPSARPKPSVLRPTPPSGAGAGAPVIVSEYAHTGAKLGWAALAYIGCVVLVITLQPFTFRWPRSVDVMFWAPDSPWGGWFDVVANVALFIPLGFVAALARTAAAPAGAKHALAWVTGWAAAASAGIELVQCLEPGRYPSPTDVATNAAGAWLGAWLRRRAAAHLGADTALVTRLALELPVMGLVYVTLPLLTLAGLTAGGAPGAGDTRALAVVALAAFGGTLLGTVQRRHLGPSGATRASEMAGAAALWFAVGALPAAVTARGAYAAGVVVAATTAWFVGRGGTAGVRAIERRFESEAIGRAAPWLAAYLALVPLGDPAEAAWGRLTILRDLERVAGFTVLGYLLAEAWGRREWRYRHSAWRVALVGAAAAGVATAVGAWGAGSGVAVGAGVLTRAVAAAYGGWIYHLQRGHVRALVAARRPANARAAAGASPAAARVA
jgi:VanZ family protein